MAALGEEYTPNITIGSLKAQLTSKGYIYYAPEGIGDLGVWMHPIKLRGLVLVGADTDNAKVYQVQAVNNAIRRS